VQGNSNEGDLLRTAVQECGGDAPGGAGSRLPTQAARGGGLPPAAPRHAASLRAAAVALHDADEAPPGPLDGKDMIAT
jgi:hypothetical protein